MLKKIISGGQTGVDRAALDVALELGIPAGGWCPKGRRAEDGPIPEQYPLQETDSEEYPVRTEKNVRESDGTLILTRGKPDRGTALTIKLAKQHNKPFWVVDLDKSAKIASLRSEIESAGIVVLNVAGPRASSFEGIGQQSADFLRKLFGKLLKQR